MKCYYVILVHMTHMKKFEFERAPGRTTVHMVPVRKDAFYASPSPLTIPEWESYLAENNIKHEGVTGTRWRP